MIQLQYLFLSLLCLMLNSCNLSGQAGNIHENEIIFKDEKGNEISISDLEGISGKVNYEMTSKINVPEEASRLHQEARIHGGKGELDKGIEKLIQASAIAPDWAYPIYDLGYTYLLKKDYPNALKYYKLTNEMEPRGFFTAKTAYWALKKEKEGTFPEGLYLAYMQIEWYETNLEKLDLAKRIVSKFPNYAPAWKVIAQKSESSEERLNAVKRGLNSNPDKETEGTLKINQALVINTQGNTEEAIKLLGNIVFDENSTLASIELAKFVLSTIKK